jgi:hypothetical protein
VVFILEVGITVFLLFQRNTNFITLITLKCLTKVIERSERREQGRRL